MEHAEYTYTVGMERAEMDDRLRAHQTAVLSLARDGDAYGLPVAYYYDGDSLYLRLAEESGSRKMDFIDATETATLVLYDDEPVEESWSIFATGTLRELTGEERAAFDETEINQDFIPLRVFREAIDEVDLRIFEFEVETLTGRKTTEA